MKIVLAPDKFKGSLTGIEFYNAVEEGVQLISPNAEIIKLPLADGGDDTIEILDGNLKGKLDSQTLSGKTIQGIIISDATEPKFHT